MARLKTSLICLVLVASVKSSQVRPHNDKGKTPQKTKPKDNDNDKAIMKTPQIAK